MDLGAARGWFLVEHTFLPVRSIRAQARRVERKEQIFHLPFDISYFSFGRHQSSQMISILQFKRQRSNTK